MSNLISTEIEQPFKNKHLSCSRLDLFDRCPFAFKCKYHDGCEDPGGEPSQLGKLAHRGLENIYRWVIRKKHRGLVTDKRVVKCFRKAFSEEETTSIKSFNEALGMVRGYMACRAVDHEATLGIEEEIDMKLGDHQITGYIDRIDRLGPDWVEVVDYKTSKKLFSREQLEQSLQMSLYGIAVRKKLPWAKRVTYRFEMIRHGESLTTSRTIEDLRNAARYVIELGNRIESSTSFPAKLHPLCGWCPFKGRCGAYQEAIEKGETLLSIALAKDDPEWLAQEMDRAAALVTISRRRKEELSGILLEHLDRSESEEMVLAGSRYRITQRSNRKYPRRQSLLVMSEAFERSIDDLDSDTRLSTLSKGSIAEMAREAGLTRAQQQMMMFKLGLIAKHNPGKPYVSSRKIDERRRRQ